MQSEQKGEVSKSSKGKSKAQNHRHSCIHVSKSEILYAVRHVANQQTRDRQFSCFVALIAEMFSCLFVSDQTRTVLSRYVSPVRYDLFDLVTMWVHNVDN